MAQDGKNRERIAKWLRLHLSDQVGAITFQKLLNHFASIDEVLAATPGQLESIPGIGRQTARKIAESRDRIDVEAEINLAEQLGVKIYTLEDEDYPPLLKQIHDPPPVLYVQGELTRQDNLAIAIVGSRNCSQYGLEQASRLAHFLAAAGFTIVSGLARGIDTAAHRGAIAAEGRTIAVQGRGLADVYPEENKELAGRIRSGKGAIVSELPLKFEPLSSNFPARNRIVAGLSLGTIVIEARARSGALITAKLAAEENREVMAVPGRVDAPGSYGPHQLIKDGAKLIERVEDVMDALGHIGTLIADHAAKSAADAQKKVEPSLFEDGPPLTLTDVESGIYGLMDGDTVHMDEVMARTKFSPGQVNAALTSLQLKGLIKQLPGSYFTKRKNLT